MQEKKPNIVLVTADSLRADHLGCYGYTHPTSPNIDLFAQNGIRFTNAFSAGPNTPHAFPSIMAARYALSLNRLGLFEVPFTLPEVLRDAGYRTIGFNAANPYISRFFHYHRGFDEFYDYLDFSIDLNSQAIVGDSPISIPNLDLNRYLVSEEVVLAKASLENRINNDCFESIKRVGKRPFFLWIHYMDTHYPYLPQEQAFVDLGLTKITREENLKLNTLVRENLALSSTLLSRINQLYDASISQLDSKIGQLFWFLKENDLYESSLMIITADHGEEFKEHGDLQHKSKLFDELLRVPLILKLPFARESETWSKQVSLLQLAATILSIAKIDNPFNTNGFMNNGLAPPQESNRIFAAAGYYHHYATPVDNKLLNVNLLSRIYCCREGHWKLIIDTAKKRKFLYNLFVDSQETKNVYGNEKHQTLALEEDLRSYIRTLEIKRLKSQVAAIRNRIFSKRQMQHAVRPSS